jgi:two-component system, LytTR family, response regulator AlgR
MNDAPQKLRTLIVDDEPLAVERLEILCNSCPELEVIGHANDGIQALTMADELTPDLVLLDIEMPKMDGIAAARALRLTILLSKHLISTSSTIC